MEHSGLALRPGNGRKSGVAFKIQHADISLSWIVTKTRRLLGF